MTFYFLLRLSVKADHLTKAAITLLQPSKDVDVEKIDSVDAILDRSSERKMERLMRGLEATSKRRKLFESFGVALRDISPE